MDILREFVGRAQAAQKEINDITRAAKVKTAWDAGGDWWWIDKFMLRIKGGRTLYETATVTPRLQSVRLFRADNATDGLRSINRYVGPDTLVELVPREAAHK